MQPQAQNYSSHQIHIVDQTTTQLNASTPPEGAQNITTNTNTSQSANLIQPPPQQSFTQQPQAQLPPQQNEQDHQPIQSTVVNAEQNSNVISIGAKVTTQQQSGGGGDGRTRRSNKSSERIPKLVILSVQNGTLVDCSMESKLKTIKFKFDISDVNPIDVANDLVGFNLTAFIELKYSHKLLLTHIMYLYRYQKNCCQRANAMYLPKW